MTKKNQPTLNQRKEYISFLEKRLNSKNYKNNVSKEEYEKTKDKLKKEKLIISLQDKFKK